MEQFNYKKANILVVDDMNANLVILTEIIRNAGYIARPVTSAEMAMSAIGALLPHLILLDISMPDINGFEFCAMLKKNYRTRDIPVIFISSFYSREDKLKSFRLGAVDYITKPFEVEEITIRINTHLKIFNMQQNLEAYNKRLYKIINNQIRTIYEEQKNVMYALARLVERRDNRSNHLIRIGKNSRLLAMGMQLSPRFKEEISSSFIETIELAAQLHDIGKIAIKDCILLKTDPLTEEEQEILKSHSEVGARTLKEIFDKKSQNQFGRMAINIAWSHHENWDGSGYPRGLSGTDIPLCARIVSIIDTYDILTHEWKDSIPYTHEQCIAMINMDAGIKFDPEIVDVLNKIQNQLVRG